MKTSIASDLNHWFSQKAIGRSGNLPEGQNFKLRTISTVMIEIACLIAHITQREVFEGPEAFV